MPYGIKGRAIANGNNKQRNYLMAKEITNKVSTQQSRNLQMGLPFNAKRDD